MLRETVSLKFASDSVLVLMLIKVMTLYEIRNHQQRANAVQRLQ